MARIKDWKPYIMNYEKIIGVECENEEGIGKLVMNISSKKLIICPFEIIGYTLIIPRSAQKYLNLKGVNYKIVELRNTWHLSGKVLRELARRFENDLKPNYYTTLDIVARNFVDFSVVKEIEDQVFLN